MSVISVRTTEEEKRLIQEYADFFGMTMSDFIKNSVVERIEDLFDLTIIEDYEKRNHTEQKESFTHEEIMKEFELK